MANDKKIPENTAESTPKKTTSKINRRSLLVVLMAIVLLALAALSTVGIFLGIRSITSDDNDTNDNDIVSSQNDSEQEASDDDSDNNNQNDTGDNDSNSGESDEDQDIDGNDANDNTDDTTDTEADDNIANVADENTDELNNDSAEPENENQGSVSSAFTEAKNQWVANNYKEGDIQPGSQHTVIYGDTLWELADGAYGNGSAWTSILNANPGAVGFLPDGSHALIFPGQVLTIP